MLASTDSGYLMVARLRQGTYAPEMFDVSNTNLHYSDLQPSRILVMFIHGLGGSGYKTWQNFPKYLFEAAPSDRCDVAVFDYVSGFRRLRSRKAPMTFYIAQVVDAIRQLQAHYDTIFLIGHSLGGIVAESATISYLQGLPTGQVHTVSPLAAIIYMGSPRAGSAWALPVLGNLVDEGRMLRTMSSHSAGIDNYLVSNTSVALTAPITTDTIFLPRYVFYSGTDRWVNEFSSTFGIPGTQRIPLAVSHTKMPKPRTPQSEQVLRVQAIIRDVVEARQQRIRELTHAGAHSARTIPAVSPTVTTEFWAPPDASHWTQLYNEVRETVTNADIAVLDSSTSGSDVDLLISASHAMDVVDLQPAERQRFDDAYERKKSSPQLTVGFAPVGPVADAAATVILGWHSSAGAAPNIYIQAASDVTALRNTLIGWIHLIVSRDPRRGRIDLINRNRPFALDDRLYNLPDGGIN
jgi:pimeloyl-ACP methyl ester carboxylesterase